MSVSSKRELQLKKVFSVEDLSTIGAYIDTTSVQSPLTVKTSLNQFSILTQPGKQAVFVTNRDKRISAQNKEVNRGVVVPFEPSLPLSPTIQLKLSNGNCDKEVQITKLFSGLYGHATCYEAQVYNHNSTPHARLFMEEFQGSLGSVVDGSEYFSIKKILTIMRDVAIAIHTMHKKGYYHGDLKPRNMLYNDDHGALCDYGLSDGFSTLNDHMQKGFYGHPSYTAPELFGSRQFSGSIQKVEAFAFGLSLYELLEKELPSWTKFLRIAAYEPESVTEKQQLHLKTQIDEFLNNEKALLPSIKCPHEMKVKELFLTLLDCDPQKRPSFPEVITQLNQILEKVS